MSNVVAQSPNKRRIIPPVLGAAVGLIVGLLTSRALSLGERLQQLNLANTGSTTIRAVLDTKRMGSDGEVTIEPG